MELLKELFSLQKERGFIEDDELRALARKANVPLYRLEGLVSFYPHFRRTPPPEHSIEICRDVVCSMFGNESVCRRIREIQQEGNVEYREVSCLGRCDSPPAVAVNEVPLDDPELVFDLVRSSASLPANNPTTTPRRWKCDPYSTTSQRYSTLRSMLESAEDVQTTCVSRLTESGLRGMGGAGFPTGKKWSLVAAQRANPKYVICNADESEPGTFKDRVILEELPHLVIEGMILAGLSIGAKRGIVYLRHEYDRERKALELAMADARSRSMLGEDIAGTGQNFDIEIFISPGGYILGEETALLEALEDKRGEPRNKPPYPGTHGLWGKPTLINNVESFALATSIVHHGNDWWQLQGHEGFSGLKFVCISGDVENPGVYEIPHGLPVSELISLAGGVLDGKRLKAFLPGGASSNFLPAERVDTALDFDAMAAAGSMLGTGAVIVFAEGRDILDHATNLVRFFRNESCGKCVPCRIGSEKAVQLLDSVLADRSTASRLDVLPELGQTLQQTSICGLGQVALNPVLSMLQHFPDIEPEE